MGWILLLAIGGLFFPPVWLGLVGYLIYFFASRKSRRNDAVQSRVNMMVRGGQASAIFKDLYFEAARSYAVSQNPHGQEVDVASVKMFVDGRLYYVQFLRNLSGGTEIWAKDYKEVEREILADFPRGFRGMA